MDLPILLILGLLIACCVIPMYFFMGKKRGSNKSADKLGDGAKKS